MLASGLPYFESPASRSSAPLQPPASASSSFSVALTAESDPVHGNEDHDRSVCQAAYDFPSNFSPCDHRHVDAIGNLATSSLYKSCLTRKNSEAMKSGLDCVQCVEVFPDSMNHCVPDWDATGGKEMDNLWEQPDLFSPRKGKWDSGHARKSDSGFVPELDFEELCWEDGQLLVVMQGLSSRGTTKNRSTNQTDDTTLLTVSPTTGTFDTPRATELDLSSVCMQTQEDELFSWLQHPPEDLVERLEVTSDLPMVSACLAPISKLTKSDTPQCKGNRIGHGDINQCNESSAEPTLVPTETTQKELPCEPCVALTAEAEISSRSLIHPGSTSVQCGKSRPNPSATAINFPNFSRPAVKIKADLQSLGIVNGLQAPERLKQLEKVAANMRQSESAGHTMKHPKVIAPRKEISAAISENVEASFRQDDRQNSPLEKEAEQIAPAGCRDREPKQYMPGKKGADQGISTLTKHLLEQAQSNACNSSFITSTNAGKDAITEVREIPEPSGLSSSGGSEDSDHVNEKRASSTLKRKTYDEDSEVQSEELEKKKTGNKKQLTAGGNDLKKSRATENHNQSERRRRDRISEKMKTLQELLPNSYKTDKASMLDEAISYIKALKTQIEMMSRASSMYFSPVVPSHGVQHVQMAAWPLMNMGAGMNMGMGMGMAMNLGMGMPDMNTVMATPVLRPFPLPMIAFPNTLGPALQTSTSAELNAVHKTPGIGVSAFPSPHHQLMAFIRPGNLMSCKSDSTQVGNAAPTPSCPPPPHQQGHIIQSVPASCPNGCG